MYLVDNSMGKWKIGEFFNKVHVKSHVCCRIDERKEAF